MNNEIKMKIVKMCTLRQMCDMTRSDRIRNEYTRGRLGVTNMTWKTREKFEIVWTGQEEKLSRRWVK